MAFIERGIYEQPANDVRQARRFLSLLRALVVRDFTGRYRRSILGPAWAVLQPVAYTAVFVLVRNVMKNAVQIEEGNVPYVLVAFTAMVPWAFFANAVTRCGNCMLSNASVLKKMPMRREVFPAAAVSLSMLDMLISGVVLCGLMMWYRIPLTVSVVWLPLLMVTVVLLACGIGLGVAALGTYRRDIILGVPILLQIGLLASPVMFSLHEVSEKTRFLMTFNPMVGIIEGFRSVLLDGQPPDATLLFLTWASITVIWLIAWPLFSFMSQYFADIL